MHVRPLTAFVLSAAALTGAGGAQALAAGPPLQRISATLELCHPAADLTGRYATFAAQMSAISGTEQMSIRLELDERTPAAPDFRPVSGVPGFGVWKSSAPGVDIFGYSQEVSSLSAPASFRVMVNYRWLGARHRVIRRARRTTPACRMPAAASNLLVGSLTRRPAVPPAGGVVLGLPCAAGLPLPVRPLAGAPPVACG